MGERQRQPVGTISLAKRIYDSPRREPQPNSHKIEIQSQHAHTIASYNTFDSRQPESFPATECPIGSRLASRTKPGGSGRMKDPRILRFELQQRGFPPLIIQRPVNFELPMRQPASTFVLRSASPGQWAKGPIVGRWGRGEERPTPDAWKLSAPREPNGSWYSCRQRVSLVLRFPSSAVAWPPNSATVKLCLVC